MHNLTDASDAANDAIQQRGTQLATRFFSFFVALGLLPLFVLALVSFGSFPEAKLITHASTIYKLVPGLELSFENIIQYRPSSDAAKFVVCQFWGFVSNSLIALLFAITWALTVINHQMRGSVGLESTKDAYGREILDAHRAKLNLGRQVLLFLLPLSFWLIFFFLPVAYVPAVGTSSGKAYGGSLLMATLINSLWGIFAFIWLAKAALTIAQAFQSRSNKISSR